MLQPSVELAERKRKEQVIYSGFVAQDVKRQRKKLPTILAG
jgi:hypothetical protein